MLLESPVISIPWDTGLVAIETKNPKSHPVLLNKTMADALINLQTASPLEGSLLEHLGRLVFTSCFDEKVILEMKRQGELEDFFEQYWETIFELQQRYKRDLIQGWIFGSWQTSEKFSTFFKEQTFFLRPELISKPYLFLVNLPEKSTDPLNFSPVLINEGVIWNQ